MARIDELSDFQGRWQRQLARLQAGDVVCNNRLLGLSSPDAEDDSVEQADAVLLHAKFGAIRDDAMSPAQWCIDWSDKSAPKPLLKLSPDLFRHVADQTEKG